MNKFTPMLLLFSVLMVGCVAHVKTYQNKDYEFSNYETWCWLKGCEITYQGPNLYYDQRVIDEIANSIAVNMYEKGYIQGDDSSDLAVNYYITIKEDSTSVSDEYSDMISTSFYPRYEKFLKGSLIIDIIDREKSELVWRSTAQRYLEIYPEYDEEMIQKTVTKTMKKVPSKSKAN
ncbi:MAG: DUF4136 domain-containing protein [Bacteroidota bacterium]